MFYSGLQKQRLSPWGQKDPLLRHFANSWPFVGLDEERRACDLQEGRRSERRCPARKPSLLTRAASLSTCHSPGSLPTSSCASMSCPEALPRAKLQLREASKSAYHQAPALLQAPPNRPSTIALPAFAFASLLQSSCREKSAGESSNSRLGSPPPLGEV